MVMENEPEKAKWTVQQVADWIGVAGDAKYAELFRQHQVTGRNLVEMKKNGLKDIGITKIGPRKKIWNLIQNLQKEVMKESRDISKKQTIRHSSKKMTIKGVNREGWGGGL